MTKTVEKIYKGILAMQRCERTCVVLKSTLFPLILIRMRAIPLSFAFSCLSLCLCKTSGQSYSAENYNELVCKECVTFLIPLYERTEAFEVFSMLTNVRKIYVFRKNVKRWGQFFKGANFLNQINRVSFTL